MICKDKIVCIENIDNDQREFYDNDNDVFNLTIGKIYEVRLHQNIDECGLICLLNDGGVYNWYSSSLFVSLEEYRNQQIEKILI